MKIRKIGNLYFACALISSVAITGAGATMEEALKNFNAKLEGGVRVCQ